MDGLSKCLLDCLWIAVDTHCKLIRTKGISIIWLSVSEWLPKWLVDKYIKCLKIYTSENLWEMNYNYVFDKEDLDWIINMLLEKLGFKNFKYCNLRFFPLER